MSLGCERHTTRMLSTFKAILTDILAAMLQPRLLKLFHRRPLTILMYHGVIETPSIVPDPSMVNINAFRAQLRYLKKHFEVVSLTDAAALLEQDAIAEPTVVITFDDGYQNNYDLAYPVLFEEDLPATIFLSTLFANSDTTIWTRILQNAFAVSPKSYLEWDGRRFDLSTPAESMKSMGAVKSLLKGRPNLSLMQDVDMIVAALSEGDPICLDADSPYRMLDSESIGELAKSDLIELGAHTHSHYILSQLPDSVQAVEIRRSLELVQSFTGKPCHMFAYPNGRKCDYNDESLSILQENGVKIALTTEPGTCDANTPLLELKRIGVTADVDMPSFKLSLFNVQGRLKELLGKTA